jgi:hypothetical protein
MCLDEHDASCFLQCIQRKSLAYMLIYFLCNKLPWLHVQGATDDATWELIHAIKTKTELALKPGLHAVFDALFRYARALDFADAPDYAGLRALFARLAERSGTLFDGWCNQDASTGAGAHKGRAGAGGGGGHPRACAAFALCACFWQAPLLPAPPLQDVSPEPVMRATAANATRVRNGLSLCSADRWPNTDRPSHQ